MKKFILLFSVLSLVILSIPAYAVTPIICKDFEVRYLGDSGKLEANEGMKLVVKKLRPFRFEFVGTTYRATNERVWEIEENIDSFPVIYDGEIELGTWDEGTQIIIQIIDDDFDNRMTYIEDTKGNVFTEFEPELSYKLNFLVTERDSYTLVTEDSIGVYNICVIEPTPTTTPTNTLKTPTSEPTPVITVTPISTPSPTITVQAPTPFSTPTDVPTGLTPEPEWTLQHLYLPSIYR